jgi:non-ribosomal peptide synthetase component F
MHNVGRILKLAISYLLTEEDRLVGKLDFFAEEDWQRISKWNSRHPQTRDCCVHDIIQDQCRKRLSKDAICAWDGSLTYSELDSQATRLACYLQSQGIGPEVLVPLCFDKSVSERHSCTVHAIASHLLDIPF